MKSAASPSRLAAVDAILAEIELTGYGMGTGPSQPSIRDLARRARKLLNLESGSWPSSANTAQATGAKDGDAGSSPAEGHVTSADLDKAFKVLDEAERFVAKIEGPEDYAVAPAIATARYEFRAEIERLLTWLSRIRNNAQSWHGADPDGIDHAHHGQQKALNVIAGWCEEALNGE